MLKPEYGGGLHEVSLDQIDFFLDVETEQNFFTSQERQSLILDRLNEIKAFDKEESPFSQVSFLEDQPISKEFREDSIISRIIVEFAQLLCWKPKA